MTFETGLSEYMQARCLGRKRKTVEFYQDIHRIMLRHWPAPGIAVGDILPAHVLAFGEAAAGLCASRWNAAVSALRALHPHGRLLRRRALNVRRFSPPNQQEFAALLAECDLVGRKSVAGIVARFLAFTGLRISEARGLRWENVGADRIEVPGSLAKNGRGRAVPVLPELGPVLRVLRARARGPEVLPRKNPRKAIEAASRKALGVQWSFHCFRHLFATRCIESGVDMPTLARWLGHSDGGALLGRVYFHLADSHSREMASRVRIGPGESQVRATASAAVGAGGSAGWAGV